MIHENLYKDWFVVLDDIMGKFAVATADKPVSQLARDAGERVVARVIDQPAAELMVANHAEWLQENPPPE